MIAELKIASLAFRPTKSQLVTAIELGICETDEDIRCCNQGAGAQQQHEGEKKMEQNLLEASNGSVPLLTDNTNADKKSSPDPAANSSTTIPPHRVSEVGTEGPKFGDSVTSMLDGQMKGVGQTKPPLTETSLKRKSKKADGTESVSTQPPRETDHVVRSPSALSGVSSETISFSHRGKAATVGAVRKSIDTSAETTHAPNAASAPVPPTSDVHSLFDDQQDTTPEIVSEHIVLGLRVVVSIADTEAATVQTQDVYFLIDRNQLQLLSSRGLLLDSSLCFDREIDVEFNEAFILGLPAVLKDTYTDHMRISVDCTIYNVPTALPQGSSECNNNQLRAMRCFLSNRKAAAELYHDAKLGRGQFIGKTSLDKGQLLVEETVTEVELDTGDGTSTCRSGYKEHSLVDEGFETSALGGAVVLGQPQQQQGSNNKKGNAAKIKKIPPNRNFDVSCGDGALRIRRVTTRDYQGGNLADMTSLLSRVIGCSTTLIPPLPKDSRESTLFEDMDFAAHHQFSGDFCEEEVKKKKKKPEPLLRLSAALRTCAAHCSFRLSTTKVSIWSLLGNRVRGSPGSIPVVLGLKSFFIADPQIARGANEPAIAEGAAAAQRGEVSATLLVQFSAIMLGRDDNITSDPPPPKSGKNNSPNRNGKHSPKRGLASIMNALPGSSTYNAMMRSGRRKTGVTFADDPYVTPSTATVNAIAAATEQAPLLDWELIGVTRLIRKILGLNKDVNQEGDDENTSQCGGLPPFPGTAAAEDRIVREGKNDRKCSSRYGEETASGISFDSAFYRGMMSSYIMHVTLVARDIVSFLNWRDPTRNVLWIIVWAFIVFTFVFASVVEPEEEESPCGTASNVNESTCDPDPDANIMTNCYEITQGTYRIGCIVAILMFIHFTRYLYRLNLMVKRLVHGREANAHRQDILEQQRVLDVISTMWSNPENNLRDLVSGCSTSVHAHSALRKKVAAEEAAIATALQRRSKGPLDRYSGALTRVDPQPGCCGPSHLHATIAYVIEARPVMRLLMEALNGNIDVATTPAEIRRRRAFPSFWRHCDRGTSPATPFPLPTLIGTTSHPANSATYHSLNFHAWLELIDATFQRSVALFLLTVPSTYGMQSYPTRIADAQFSMLLDILVRPPRHVRIQFTALVLWVVLSLLFSDDAMLFLQNQETAIEQFHAAYPIPRPSWALMSLFQCGIFAFLVLLSASSHLLLWLCRFLRILLPLFPHYESGGFTQHLRLNMTPAEETTGSVTGGTPQLSTFVTTCLVYIAVVVVLLPPAQRARRLAVFTVHSARRQLRLLVKGPTPLTPLRYRLATLRVMVSAILALMGRFLLPGIGSRLPKFTHLPRHPMLFSGYVNPYVPQKVVFEDNGYPWGTSVNATKRLRSMYTVADAVSPTTLGKTTPARHDVGYFTDLCGGGGQPIDSILRSDVLRIIERSDTTLNTSGMGTSSNPSIGKHGNPQSFMSTLWHAARMQKSPPGNGSADNNKSNNDSNFTAPLHGAPWPSVPDPPPNPIFAAMCDEGQGPSHTVVYSADVPLHMATGCATIMTRLSAVAVKAWDDALLAPYHAYCTSEAPWNPTTKPDDNPHGLNNPAGLRSSVTGSPKEALKAMTRNLRSPPDTASSSTSMLDGIRRTVTPALSSWMFGSLQRRHPFDCCDHRFHYRGLIVIRSFDGPQYATRQEVASRYLATMLGDDFNSKTFSQGLALPAPINLNRSDNNINNSNHSNSDNNNNNNIDNEEKRSQVNSIHESNAGVMDSNYNVFHTRSSSRSVTNSVSLRSSVCRAGGNPVEDGHNTSATAGASIAHHPEHATSTPEKDHKEKDRNSNSNRDPHTLPDHKPPIAMQSTSTTNPGNTLMKSIGALNRSTAVPDVFSSALYAQSTSQPPQVAHHEVPSSTGVSPGPDTLSPGSVHSEGASGGRKFNFHHERSLSGLEPTLVSTLRRPLGQQQSLTARPLGMPHMTEPSQFQVTSTTNNNTITHNSTINNFKNTINDNLKSTINENFRSINDNLRSTIINENNNNNNNNVAGHMGDTFNALSPLTSTGLSDTAALNATNNFSQHSISDAHYEAARRHSGNVFNNTLRQGARHRHTRSMDFAGTFGGTSHLNQTLNNTIANNLSQHGSGHSGQWLGRQGRNNNLTLTHETRMSASPGPAPQREVSPPNTKSEFGNTAHRHQHQEQSHQQAGLTPYQQPFIVEDKPSIARTANSEEK